MHRQPKRVATVDVTPARAVKMLIVCPYDLFAEWAGGSIRIIRLAREFVKHGHDVTVLAPRRRTQKHGRHEPFTVWQTSYPFVMRHLLIDRPFPFHYLMSIHPGLGLAVGSLLRGFDVVQFEHVSFAGLLRAVPEGTLIGYDAHNVEYDYVRQECRSRRVADIVGRRIGRLEQHLVRESDCVFPVSTLDQERMSSLYGLQAGKCTLAPNGIDTAREAGSDDAAMIRRLPELGRFRTRAIFSGSIADHNRSAIAFLLERVVPAAPDIAFVIHGTCALQFQRVCSASNVFFDPDPECGSFADYAVRGTIGLNPVETGGGTNLKLLQYLSHGLPVLSTPFGMRGYDDLASYVRVEPRDAFATALLDGGFPAPPSPSFLQDRYSWGTIAARMAQAYIRARG